MIEEKNVDDMLDNPIDDVMDLFPTDHEVEEETVIEESIEDITEETETDESQTEEVEGEESDEETSEEETEETEAVSLEELEIKVLGKIKQLKDIPREELQSTVRKGQDYDRIREKLNTKQEEANEWYEVSKMYNMTPQEVIEVLKEQKYNEIAETSGKNPEDVKREYEANKKSVIEKMYDKFVSKYPDVKVDDLPEDVTDAVKDGQDLMSVYEEFVKKESDAANKVESEALKNKIAELEAKLRVKKQNLKTKKKGVVKKTSGKDSNTNTDDFLSGLMGDY